MAYFLGGIIALCGLLIALNWLSLWDAMRQGRGFSFMPGWVCGIGASAALWFYPDSRAQAYWWLPLVLDPSLAPFGVALLWQSLRDYFRRP